MRKLLALLLVVFSGSVWAAASTDQVWQLSKDGVVLGQYSSYADGYAVLNTYAGNPWQVCSGMVAVMLRRSLDACPLTRASIVLISARCPLGQDLSPDGLSCAAGASAADPVGVLGLRLSDLMAAVMIGLLVLVYVGGVAVGQQR